MCCLSHSLSNTVRGGVRGFREGLGFGAQYEEKETGGSGLQDW